MTTQRQQQHLEVLDWVYYFLEGLPTEPVKLTAWETILDPAKFLDGHTQFILHNAGKPCAQPYVDRLYDFVKFFLK